jgi:hypothetical protein
VAAWAVVRSTIDPAVRCQAPTPVVVVEVGRANVDWPVVVGLEEHVIRSRITVVVAAAVVVVIVVAVSETVVDVFETVSATNFAVNRSVCEDLRVVAVVVAAAALDEVRPPIPSEDCCS